MYTRNVKCGLTQANCQLPDFGVGWFCVYLVLCFVYGVIIDINFSPPHWVLCKDCWVLLGSFLYKVLLFDHHSLLFRDSCSYQSYATTKRLSLPRMPTSSITVARIVIYLFIPKCWLLAGKRWPPWRIIEMKMKLDTGCKNSVFSAASLPTI